jgi:hypothetical protein
MVTSNLISLKADLSFPELRAPSSPSKIPFGSRTGLVPEATTSPASSATIARLEKLAVRRGGRSPFSVSVSWRVVILMESSNPVDREATEKDKDRLAKMEGYFVELADCMDSALAVIDDIRDLIDGRDR